MVIIKRILSICILGGFAVWAIWFIHQRLYYFDQLFKIEWYYLIVLVILILFNHVLNGLILRRLVSAFQIQLAIIESASISLITSILNLVTPFRGGAGYRAYYLNKRHGLSLGHFVSIFGSHYLLNFFVKSITAIIILLYIFIIYQNLYLWLLFFFMIVVMLCAYMIFFAPSIPEAGGKLWNKIAKSVNSWDYIRKNKSIIRYFTVISIFQVISSGLILYLAFSVSKICVGLSQCFLLAIMGSFGILIGITPGSIGIVEGIFLLTSPLLGVGTEEMLVGALIRRGAGLLVLIIFAPLGWLYLAINKSG